MRERLRKLFYRLAYLDFTDECKKEDTYFYKFSREIGQSNMHMMRSMSMFILIISMFVIANTFTYFAEENLRKIYVIIVIIEIVILCFIECIMEKELSFVTSNFLAAVHLFHMLIIGGYIGVFYSRQETALIFMVVLTISSMIFTLPTILTVSIVTVCTAVMIIASYYVKTRYWFESDVLNGVSVLIFSFLLGF